MLASQIQQFHQIQKMQPKLLCYFSIIVSSSTYSLSSAFLTNNYVSTNNKQYNTRSYSSSRYYYSSFNAKNKDLYRYNSILSSSLSSQSNSDSEKSIPIINKDNKAKIIFLGTPEVAATSLETLVKESVKDDSIYDIVGVVTQPPKRRKRRGKVIPSPVGEMAEKLNIPILCPEKVS